MHNVHRDPLMFIHVRMERLSSSFEPVKNFDFSIITVK